MAIIIAALGSFGTLEIADRVKAAQSSFKKIVWFATGGFAIGSSVWGMHFVGMLSHTLPIEVVYDPVFTGLSMIPAIFVGSLFLYIVSIDTMAKLRLDISVVAISAGLISMHFIGMMGVEMNAVIFYDPVLFVGSILLANLLSVLGIFVKFQINQQTCENLFHWKRFATAWLMGFAIVGMHYATMAGHFTIPNGVPDVGMTGLNNRYLAVFTGLVIFGITGFSSLASIAGRWLEASVRLESGRTPASGCRAEGE